MLLLQNYMIGYKKQQEQPKSTYEYDGKELYAKNGKAKIKTKRRVNLPS